MSAPLPVVADLILERLDQLMAPFRRPEYTHDPATTDDFFRAFLDVVRLAPLDEHTVFKGAAQELVNTLNALPEDVRPATSVLDTFLLAYAEFTLGREVGYARQWADVQLGHARRASGALRLIQQDIANGILDGRSSALRTALLGAEIATFEYEQAEQKHAAALEHCQLLSSQSCVRRC